jgi:prepilin-type processing-associated H-X9-DG protein
MVAPTDTHANLAYAIAPYLASATTKANNYVQCKVFECPSFMKNPQYSDPARVPNAADVNADRAMYRLRRYLAGNTLWQYSGSPKIAGIDQPSGNGALVDEDRQLPGASATTVITPRAWMNLPDNPVHGKTRNYGFFDGHVSAFSLTRHADSIKPSGQPYGWFDATN